MASLLRQLVAGPRARHAEAGLDLCYVTDEMIATSGPSQAYPQRAYRNPLDQLVCFLDAKHGDGWAIWEFRAEGTGYPDEAVYGRVRHYPWPDHHPPPFRLMPLILAGMRNWLKGGPLEEEAKKEEDEDKKGEEDKKRVVVVHCKAGKGRSGTVACSYLIAEEGWKADDALARFTQRRMRPRFGAGVSIPSQLRWVSYIDRWAKLGRKHYVDRPVEVLEIHVWGLRHGVKVSVEGFIDNGRNIYTYHTFSKPERIVVEAAPPTGWGFADLVWELAGYPGDSTSMTRPDDDDANKPNRRSRRASLIGHDAASSTKPKPSSSSSSTSSSSSSSRTDKTRRKTPPDQEAEPGGMAVILRPHTPILIPHSDINIATERRSRTNPNVGLTMVSAVAHVWFNAYFEGAGPEECAAGRPAATSGVFSISWDDMDGIKGSSRKGARALDRLAVVWRVAEGARGDEVPEPETGGAVRQFEAADWTGGRGEGKEQRGGEEEEEEEMEGVRCSGPAGEEPLEQEGAKQ
ncbi:hypothetical protein CDD81_5603 [Ophiocordyceps australis]|uniref:phosphatidylinositol-3,4,5-trisphosphate 3-phosphatase n=1 Tax=Ophiocordyceps australis TaxID=1399860 RepID=A0A2C5Y8P5_9HYPO|nr:hypothetical protein CDD81_5603 [Ophiocordyceps australis]